MELQERALWGRTWPSPPLSLAFLQKLCGLHALAADPESLPHIYMEEGELEGAESLSSLAFSEHTPSLPSLLDWLGPRPEDMHPRASPKSARHYGPLK